MKMFLSLSTTVKRNVPFENVGPFSLHNPESIALLAPGEISTRNRYDYSIV